LAAFEVITEGVSEPVPFSRPSTSARAVPLSEAMYKAGNTG